MSHSTSTGPEAVPAAYPSVVILGRPNVGKSSLFNALIRKKKSIVTDVSGTTRDWVSAPMEWDGERLILIDTAGMGSNAKELDRALHQHSADQMRQASFIMCVIDGSVGVHPIDGELITMARASALPVMIAINKADQVRDSQMHALIGELSGYGIDTIVPVSAKEAQNLLMLRDTLMMMAHAHHVGSMVSQRPAARPIKITIAGRPNVGKSTLLNRLLQEERALVSDVAGTTRDSLDVLIRHKGNNVIIVDTAGLRKPAKINEIVEHFSRDRTIASIKQCDVCIVMIDATRGVEDQDVRIASYAVKEGKCLIIAVNKWDTVTHKDDFRHALDYKLEIQLGLIDAPVYYISALQNSGIDSLLDSAISLYSRSHTLITTGQLNRWLGEAVSQHMPPMSHSKRPVKLKYMVQTNTQPATFKCFTNYPDAIPLSYRRYLMKALCETYKLSGIPIVVEFCSTENPYPATEKKPNASKPKKPSSNSKKKTPLVRKAKAPVASAAAKKPAIRKPKAPISTATPSKRTPKKAIGSTATSSKRKSPRG